MLPVRKILVSTDFSEPAKEGFQKACRIAEHFGAELMVVHVNPRVPIIPAGNGAVTFNVEGYQEEVRQISKRNLEDFIVAQQTSAVAITPFVREGEVAEEIVRTAEENHADLIVIATHGYSGWKKFLLGSVTERVIRIATVPVLTIREPAE
jgi:nucleotide-binding universal stress UspA family protein